MTRSDVLDLLAALVAARRLDDERAAAILRAWEAGDIEDSDLPAPPGDDVLAALMPALLAVGFQQVAARFAALRAALGFLRTPQPVEARDEAARAILDSSGRRSDARTRRLFSERREASPDRPARLGSVRQFHEAARIIEADRFAALARLGWNGDVPPAEAQILARALVGQGAYLDEFAVRITLGRVGPGKGGLRALTEAETAARLRTYAGVPFATFYRAAMRPASLGGDYGPGWVLDYLALDDGGTCEPCRRAERGGPYIPGSAHPTPGGVCLGRGHCRCKLAPRFAPAEYDRLLSLFAA